MIYLYLDMSETKDMIKIVRKNNHLASVVFDVSYLIQNVNNFATKIL